MRVDFQLLPPCSGPTHVIDLELSDTIANVKLRLGDKVGIVPFCWDVFRDVDASIDAVLDDEKTLADYNVRPGETLGVCFHVGGGARLASLVPRSCVCFEKSALHHITWEITDVVCGLKVPIRVSGEKRVEVRNLLASQEPAIAGHVEVRGREGIFEVSWAPAAPLPNGKYEASLHRLMVSHGWHVPEQDPPNKRRKVDPPDHCWSARGPPVKMVFIVENQV